MNKILIFASSLLISFASYAAEKITLINWYKPGGAVDQYYQVLKKDLEDAGHPVDIEYVKTCGQALAIVKDSGNTFTVTSASAFIPQNEASSCRGLTPDTKSPKLFSTIGKSPFYICYTKTRQLTKSDIMQNEIKIGSAAESFTVYLNRWVKKTNNPKLSVSLYATSAEVKRAILAGDIDIWFGSHATNSTVEGKYNCFASSMKNNSKNLPFMGTLVNDPNFYEMMQVFVLWSSERLDPQVNKSMTGAFKTPRFRQYLDQGDAEHTGIGTGATATADIVLLKQIEKFYSEIQ